MSLNLHILHAKFDCKYTDADTLSLIHWEYAEDMNSLNKTNFQC